MSQTIFGDPFPVSIRCDQCQEVRTDCVAIDESTTRVTGVMFLCVLCLKGNEKRLLDIIMDGDSPWKEGKYD